ncbi:MAG: dynamin family protein [Spirochaetales bacterium]|nr:dynamin family protein [Spirochaetales bacterium]
MEDYRRIFCIELWNEFLVTQTDFFKNKKAYESFKKLYELFLNKKLSSANKKIIRSDIRKIKKHFIFGNKIDYRYLLLAELEYALSLNGRDLEEEIFVVCGFNKINEQRNIIQNPNILKDKKIIASFEHFLNYKSRISSYLRNNTKKIAVIGRTSAGKSTFINALLGKKILPSRQEETTDKLTYIYTKPYGTMSYLYDQNSKTINNDLSLKKIDELNSDQDLINELFLQCSFEDKELNILPFIFIDTPGTNTAVNRVHHDRTYSLLESQNYDAILYIDDSTYQEDCNKVLLEDLKKRAFGKTIFFILNKIDKYSDERTAIFSHYEEYLKSIGFENYKVFPVSSLLSLINRQMSNGYEVQITKQEKKIYRDSADEDDFSNILVSLKNLEQMIKEI